MGMNDWEWGATRNSTDALRRWCWAALLMVISFWTLLGLAMYWLAHR